LVFTLEPLLDVNLVLFNSETDNVDISLKSTQNIHHLRKASIIRWRRWSSLRRGGSCMLITLYWRRIRCFALTLKPKLSISLHESLTPKRILNSHIVLSLSNICHKTEIVLCDMAHKRKTYRVLVSYLEHGLQNVLAETERHPHDQGVKKFSPLQY
jgi:hypothetical protein